MMSTLQKLIKQRISEVLDLFIFINSKIFTASSVMRIVYSGAILNPVNVLLDDTPL